MLKLDIFTVLSAIAMLLMPESPVYLLKKGWIDSARKSLQWLRGPKYDIENEILQVAYLFKDEPICRGARHPFWEFHVSYQITGGMAALDAGLCPLF